MVAGGAAAHDQASYENQSPFGPGLFLHSAFRPGMRARAHFFLNPMRLQIRIPLLLLASTAVWGKGVPDEAAARLAAIYGKEEYRPRPVNGRWLKDSTYVVWESGQNGSGRELAHYHPATSERT